MTSVAERDWYTWHHDYDEPGTALAQRLAAVQDQIRAALDAAPPGPLHAISLCAGQGRDLIGALARHPRRDDVSARLVELEARWGNVPLAVASDSASASLAGLVAKQKAFDAYRAQPVSYNQRFRPVYDGQRPVNSPVRLAAWISD